MKGNWFSGRGAKFTPSRNLSPATATSTLGEELGFGEVDEHDPNVKISRNIEKYIAQYRKDTGRRP